MKLKLDENLGERCRELFAAAGHDVATVLEQKLNARRPTPLLSGPAPPKHDAS
jgi:hypothetical protein